MMARSCVWATDGGGAAMNRSMAWAAAELVSEALRKGVVRRKGIQVDATAAGDSRDEATTAAAGSWDDEGPHGVVAWAGGLVYGAYSVGSTVPERSATDLSGSFGQRPALCNRVDCCL